MEHEENYIVDLVSQRTMQNLTTSNWKECLNYLREHYNSLMSENGVDKNKIQSYVNAYTNEGRMIHNEFLRGEMYEQVFILTHSLYFFYELVCMKKNDRDELQKLVRISKGEKGSKFINMHYNEIENDYQSYWSIIKDSEQPPALIANCM